ncbi:MAG: dTDP-glucose 4,6-dehydratase [Flavobacteriaceae bacterium]|nr:dTDP-glucose 4,6-dehydratase [Flavobacteriaceae bacterium]MDG1962603.1 dTDP-glucose 4,6-dehydratase [Flavobacteriaceae bacterium]
MSTSKNILVTGGAGFIGANFVQYFVAHRADHFVVLDKLTYAGDMRNLTGLDQASNYTFEQGDICEAQRVKELFDKYKFTKVIHFAAESHVDNSITGPGAFVQTNIVGTFELLQAAYKLWMTGPQALRETYSDARFLHVSTDEVYGTLGATGLFTETTPYAPNSPYSASKAASDMLVRSYFHTYGLPVVTTNCSNNYGPNQHQEKLIPTIIRKALAMAPIPIYGDGQNIRDWLFVLDHCKGIFKALENGRLGETYNIGGRNERNNLYIAALICGELDRLRPKDNGSYKDQITFVTDRPGHDFRYAIDADKIETELGWRAEETFETGIVKTIQWYLDHPERLGLTSDAK